MGIALAMPSFDVLQLVAVAVTLTVLNVLPDDIITLELELQPFASVINTE
jgi:hypothetical protein